MTKNMQVNEKKNKIKKPKQSQSFIETLGTWGEVWKGCNSEF